jgi:hypothetical protein
MLAESDNHNWVFRRNLAIVRPFEAELRGPRGVVGAPVVGLCSAVSYSPTPWRVQYHRRWRA